MEHSLSASILSHSRNVIKIGNYLYDQREIPHCVRLFGDILTLRQEEEIIRVMNPKYPNPPEEMKVIPTIPAVAELRKRMATQFKDLVFQLAEIAPSDKLVMFLGTGILAPTDQNNWKTDGVSVSINLGSDCVMLFRKKGEPKVYRVLIPRRSLVVVKDPYLEFERRIEPDVEVVYQPSPFLDGVLVTRGYRYVLAWVISTDSTKLKYDAPADNGFGIFQPILDQLDIDVYGQLHMTAPEVERRIAQSSPDAFLKELMDLPLLFPYMKYAMSNDPKRQLQVLYQRLKQFKYTSRIDTRPYHSIPGISEKHQEWFSYAFGPTKEYCTIVSLPDDFNEMDCITNYFTEEARMNAVVGRGRLESSQKMSPYEWWVSDWRRKLFMSLIEKKEPINTETLREEIYRQLPEATLFKVSFAMSVINVLREHISSSTRRLRLLDISAGWGDRLISAFVTGCERYLGYDPNTKLIPGHREIIDQLRVLESDKFEFEVRPQPFETANLEGETFDLCFTSPPYFNFETYTNESTQSIYKYPKYETWLIHFFLASLRKAWSALRPGGAMAIHITDTREMKNVCSIMGLYVEGFLEDSRYGGVISSQARQKDDDETSGKIRRPVWIFFKNKQVSSLTSPRAVEAKRKFKKYFHWLWKAMNLRE